MPWTKTIASEARLDSAAEGSGWSIDVVLAMAAIGGMLIVPLLLNFGFYIVLRRPFVLWHIAMVALMLVQTVISTGFIHIAMDLDGATETAIMSLCYGAVAGSGLMFMLTFLERDALSPLLRRLLKVSAPLVLAGGVFTALPFEELRPVSQYGLHSAVTLAIGLILFGLLMPGDGVAGSCHSWASVGCPHWWSAFTG